MTPTRIKHTCRCDAGDCTARVCSDAGLAAERKAYLMQNIMASRYIVAQQRRLAGAEALGSPRRQHASRAASTTPSGRRAGLRALPAQVRAFILAQLQQNPPVRLYGMGSKRGLASTCLSLCFDYAQALSGYP